MKQKQKQKNRGELYAVVGLGRFGMSLARSLAEKGRDVIAIDSDRAKVDDAAEFTDTAFVVDDVSADNLRETGAGEADVAVVCIGDKLDTSILATMNLIKIGAKRVIAKATSEEMGEVLSLLGAETVYPERDMALRLASRLTSPHILEYITLSEGIDIMEIRLTGVVDGVTVVDSGIRQKFGLNIIAVRKAENGQMSTDIRPTMKLAKGDTITVIGKTADILRLEEYLGE